MKVIVVSLHWHFLFPTLTPFFKANFVVEEYPHYLGTILLPLLLEKVVKEEGRNGEKKVKSVTLNWYGNLCVL